MGDLYEDELVIEDIISRWTNNKIIILPQTIFFGKGNYSSLDNLKKIINMNNNLIITVREEASYNLCLKELQLPKDRCFLLPDMALLGTQQNNEDSLNTQYNKIIFSLRNDIEKISNDKNLKEILEILKEKNISIEYSNTVINKKIVPIKFRNKVLFNKIKEFEKADLIITDRLHSMIFAYLAKTKCIAIDNSTHKVIGVYQKWLNDMKGIKVLKSSTELTYEIIEDMLKAQKIPEAKEFNRYFIDLNKIIEDSLV